jgi:hypothetical protein
MRSAIEALLRWADHMGGWDARCWRDAEAAVETLRTIPPAPE